MAYMMGDRIIKQVALYLRISQEKRNENVATLENHRQQLIEYAKSNDMTYVEYGEVVSGGKTELEDRPQLRKLLKDIEQFDAILVVELSRLSRNGLISQTVKQYCIDYDKPILTPYGQDYDLANSDNDRLMFDVGSMISSHEHGIIGKRSKANKMQMAKAGLHISGNVPFGYTRNSKTKKLEIVEEDAKTIRYIFNLHAQGYGSFKIRDILNSEGYRAAKGGVFNLPSIKRIISNPHYKGWTIFNDRKRIKKNGKIIYETLDTIVMKDTHPPIIPPVEWDAANKERLARADYAEKMRERPSNKTGITMLKDLIFCGSCGWKMLIRKDSKISVGYTIKRCESLTENGEKCPTCGIKVEIVEAYVHQLLQEYKQELEAYLKMLEEHGDSELLENKQLKLNRLNKRLQEVTTDQKKLIDLALSGLFSNDEIAEKKQDLANLKNQLEIQRESLLSEPDKNEIQNTMEKVKEIIKLIDILPTLIPDEANEALKTFVHKIMYKREIPMELLKKSTRNKDRKLYPFQIEMKYYQI
jgi:DNA invertase Pin-like site-specific DNA recombinase